MKKLEKLKSNKLDLSMQKSVKGGRPNYEPIQMVTHVLHMVGSGETPANLAGDVGYHDVMD